MPAHVRGDERRLRVLLEQVVALAPSALRSAGYSLGRIAPIAEQRELEPAFVVVVDRLEELGRIGGVDEDRDLEPRARLPDRIELRIVEVEARTVGLRVRRPKPLPISPMPTAPALTSASSCAIAFSAQPGPTF